MRGHVLKMTPRTPSRCPFPQRKDFQLQGGSVRDSQVPQPTYSWKKLSCEKSYLARKSYLVIKSYLVRKSSLVRKKLSSEKKFSSKKKLSCEKSYLVRKCYLLCSDKRKKLPSDRSQKVRTVKELIRSDGLWRFACGDVLIGNFSWKIKNSL